MKDIKNLRPLWNIMKEEKLKLMIASILIFIAELSEVFTGYLNGVAVESITNLALQKALIYLGIYLGIRLICDSYLSTTANSMLNKIESSLTRTLGFFTYRKALDMPAYAYEKTSSGEIINRITQDTDTLNFAFSQLISMFSSLVGSFILIIYIFLHSWIIGLEILFFLTVLFLILKRYNPILKTIHKEKKKNKMNLHHR